MNGVFENWCESREVIPFQYSVTDVLCLLQQLLDKGKAFATIKVYLAAISACNVGLANLQLAATRWSDGS